MSSAISPTTYRILYFKRWQMQLTVIFSILRIPFVMESKPEHYKRVLKGRRHQRGYTQKELEERSGLPLRVIGALERGEREPSNLELVKLAVALDMPISDLLPEIYLLHLEELRVLEQELKNGGGNASQIPLTFRSVDDLRKELEALFPAVIEAIITTVLVLRSAPAAQTLLSTHPKADLDQAPDKPPRARVRASSRRKRL